jgi:hypothetical protein
MKLFLPCRLHLIVQLVNLAEVFRVWLYALASYGPNKDPKSHYVIGGGGFADEGICPIFQHLHNHLMQRELKSGLEEASNGHHFIFL